MRTYRVTLYRAGEESSEKPIYYMGEVEGGQRGDDVMHKAMVAHPDMRAHHCTLVARGDDCGKWSMLAQGMVQ